MKVKTPYQVLFVIFVALGVYYPALFAGFNSVDDLKMVEWLDNHPGGPLLDVFRPGGRFYYRPLLMLTFYADHSLWGLHPSFMHLENMLIHAANAVLVFYLARRVFTSVSINSWMPAWVAGLVFALHPIQTESVNWVSGRTDPLATLFVLAAMLTLTYALEKGRPVVGLPASFLFLAAVMSKEMSLFALPVALFLVWRWPSWNSGEGQGWRNRLLLSSWFAGPFLLGAGAYLVARLARFGVGDPAINHVLNHFRYGVFDTVRVFFKAFGFYVKKLFVPLPLNFAIIEANDHYVWLGLLVFALVLLLLVRCHLLGDYLLASFFLTLPALIIALTDVAWTPLAERYLYLPAAFWAIAVVGGSYQLFHRLASPFLLAPTTALLLVGAAWVTFERNVIWQDNLTLFTDTVKKSPNSLSARNSLAIAMMNVGRHEEARQQLEVAQRKDPSRKVINVHYNEAHTLLGEERYEEAAAIMTALFATEEKQSPDFLHKVAKVYEGVLLKLDEGESRVKVLGQLAVIYQKLYQQTGDPFVRYRQAQVSMFLGEKEKAADCFAEAFERAPRSAHYKEAAGKLAAKLCTE